MRFYKALIILALSCMGIGMTSAQPHCKLRPSMTCLLYPEGQNSDKGLEGACGPGTSNGMTGPEWMREDGALGAVSDSARIDIYFPEDPNGQMIIVCPGGAYEYVSSYNEGVYAADCLTGMGMTVGILKYRMPNGHWEVPLTDVHNAFRFCRANAEKWGVEQIGVMGFSAGGHLAATASNHFTDSITRPDFSILIYPVISMEEEITHKGTRNNLLGQDGQTPELLERYSLEKQVSEATPVTFMAHSTNDGGVPVENSIRYYRQLVDKGIDAEMHIYPYGGHGWGFNKDIYLGKGKDKLGYARNEFEASLKRWLDGIRKK